MMSDTGFAEKIGTGVNATDEDSGKFGQIRYSLDQSSFPEPYFEVDTFCQLIIRITYFVTFIIDCCIIL